MTDPIATETTAPARPRRRRKALVAGAVLALGAVTVGGIAAANGSDGDDAPLTGDVLDRVSTVAIAEAGGGRVTEASTDDDGPVAYELEVTRDDGTQVDVDLDRDLGVVRTEVEDPDDDHDGDREDRGEHRSPGRDDDRVDDDAPLTGDVLARASAAAIAEAGGGRVTDSSIDDDHGSAYEVEVTLEDGTEVDVHLDGDFTVVYSERDRPGQDD